MVDKVMDQGLYKIPKIQVRDEERKALQKEMNLQMGEKATDFVFMKPLDTPKFQSKEHIEQCPPQLF